MTTIARVHLNADFSLTNIGFFEREAEVAVPSGLWGFWRLGRTLAQTLRDRAEIMDATTFGADYTVNPLSFSITATGTSCLITARTLSAPYTILSIIAQPASAPSQAQNLGGNPVISGASSGIGLIRRNAGDYEAIVRSASTDYKATLAADGGARYELLAAVFDDAADEITLRRPRTDDTVTVANTVWPTMSSNFRVLGNTSGASGPIEGLGTMVFDRALSVAEIDAIYASWQTSLAAVDVDI